MEKDSRIYVAGYTGLLGSALVRKLGEEGYGDLILPAKATLDLRDQVKTKRFFQDTMPEYVFFAAGKVGGLQANSTLKAEFIRDNIQMQANVIHSSFESGVKKLLYVSSNCAYPKECPQPMKEEDLMTGKFEPTNQPFAVAKMAGMEMCKAYNFQYETNFITVIPASLYGPGDNYDLENAHMVSTLIKKCHEAKVKGEKEVKIPGSEERVREMMHIDDAADACLFLMNNYNSSEEINAGIGKGHTIREISDLVKKVVGFDGEIKFDKDKPTGMLKKVLDSERINRLGWSPQIEFEEGLQKTYGWYLDNQSQ